VLAWLGLKAAALARFRGLWLSQNPGWAKAIVHGLALYIEMALKYMFTSSDLCYTWVFLVQTLQFILIAQLLTASADSDPFCSCS
jgi:hypothetical protein